MREILEALPLLIPIVALLIPIVAVLTKHQQRMAEIMAQGKVDGPSSEISALRGEVSELKRLLYQQTIVLDNIAGQSGRTVPLVERNPEGAPE